MPRWLQIRTVGLVGVWLLFAVPLWFVLFFNSHTSMALASHDARISPTPGHYAQVELGPYLPDFRMRISGHIGVEIALGKTSADSASELAQRYALIASRPDPEVRRITHEIKALALTSAVEAALIALAPIALWMLLGAERRQSLLRPTLRGSVAVVCVAGLVGLVVVQPWRPDPPRVQPTQWIPLQEAIPEVKVPAELDDVDVQGGLLTSGTRKLVSSSFVSYANSKEFFKAIEDRADTIAELLRKPAKGETVAVLVSDRHDNITMDAVVRKVADLAGATVILDAGDDTSTGGEWEAFSLDSLNDAFKDYDARVAISGNHDHGTFVSGYLKRMGWTHLEAKPVDPFAGVRFFGVDDPRSSGLGSWLDEKGLSFKEVESRVADELCRLDGVGERVATLLVHSAALGRSALERGCVDLVLGGHLHRQVGPDRVVGTNGKVGYSYTNGTTGGAAYAIAIASKLRREAEFTMVTYSHGRAIGLQPVRISPAGEYAVDNYIPLYHRF